MKFKLLTSNSKSRMVSREASETLEFLVSAAAAANASSSTSPKPSDTKSYRMLALFQLGNSLKNIRCFHETALVKECFLKDPDAFNSEAFKEYLSKLENFYKEIMSHAKDPEKFYAILRKHWPIIIPARPCPKVLGIQDLNFLIGVSLQYLGQLGASTCSRRSITMQMFASILGSSCGQEARHSTVIKAALKSTVHTLAELMPRPVSGKAAATAGKAVVVFGSGATPERNIDIILGELRPYGITHVYLVDRDPTAEAANKAWSDKRKDTTILHFDLKKLDTQAKMREFLKKRKIAAALVEHPNCLPEANFKEGKPDTDSMEFLPTWRNVIAFSSSRVPTVVSILYGHEERKFQEELERLNLNGRIRCTSQEACPLPAEGPGRNLEMFAALNLLANNTAVKSELMFQMYCKKLRPNFFEEDDSGIGYYAYNTFLAPEDHAKVERQHV